MPGSWLEVASVEAFLSMLSATLWTGFLCWFWNLAMYVMLVLGSNIRGSTKDFWS